ncbi:MAG: photosynthetic reaction center cytochrome PufC [Sphingomonadaceae bacterium]
MNKRLTIAALPLAALIALPACELGPKEVEQTGYRGTGLEQIYDPDNFVTPAAMPDAPYALPPDTGPRAGAVYQNVQVLGDMSVERFDHLMAAITEWVSPEQGCNYCHDPANLAADNVYTKIVARQMIEMTRAINGRWASHVGDTGVTCFTCHRGEPVPTFIWANRDRSDDLSVRGQRRGQNAPSANVGYSSLPYDVFRGYFSGDPDEIRVASNSGYPSKRHQVPIKAAEESYGIMMHLSEALGVNCTYCHNTQSFREWTLSRAQRATAYYGIRMVRDINHGYIRPLTGILPAARKGPAGDPFKVNCLTCHNGQAKPLGGVSVLSQYPYMRPPGAVSAADQVGPEGAVPELLERPEMLTQPEGGANGL